MVRVIQLRLEFALAVKRPQTLRRCQALLAVCGLMALTSPCLGAPMAPSHWAFVAPARVEPPAVRDTSWSRNPIDPFILASMEASGLAPATAATREQLIRRATFGLLGLPPTAEERDAFVHDRSSGAYERLIDRLLASPHYGERWARHWLDLVRYAETDGFEHDALRPHAWRFRDYVIKSFNEDKPYDRFVREQIAGDEMWPHEPDAVTATAFHLLGPDMVDSADPVQRRLNTLNDATDTTASVFLGLTFGCARCHHHKFEPLTQQDYFAMQAFFAPAVFQREMPIPTAFEQAAHDRGMERYRTGAAATQKSLHELEAAYREKLHAERLARLSPDARLAHQTPKEKRTTEQEGTVAETAPMMRFTDSELARSMSVEDQARRTRLLEALKKVPKPLPLPMTMALQNKSGPPPRTFVLARGDFNHPEEEMRPGFPAVLAGRGLEPAAQAESQGSRIQRLAAHQPRTALAHWIASTENPLTARVMVNRIWQHHFGRGLVSTPSDFGTRGAVPTHPELLDWLAREFVARAWSVKAMHKLILLSSTYQQSSHASSETLARDPDNRLFSRQNRRRLEGEAVRDSLLAISGRLNRHKGGPGVSPPIPADLARSSKSWTTSTDLAHHTRRSIYILARRNLRFPFLEVFDAPDSNLSCPERGSSTTAPQALTLLNSDEAMEAARAAARRLLHEAPTAETRVALAFRLVLGRRPTAQEQGMVGDFLKSSSRRSSEVPAPNSEIRAADSGITEAAWAELCRALFNLNAFVYVD